MKNVRVALLALGLAALACLQGRPTAPPIDLVGTQAAMTVQAATTATPRVTPAPVIPTPPAGLPYTFQGVYLVIPNGLATGAQTVNEPASTSPDVPWDVHPAYTHITLQGYPLQGKFFQPEIFIYPADAFGQMSAGAAQAINDLKTLLASQGPLPDKMPFLPPFNAAQVFYSNPAKLSFQNGTGVRYLTQYDQAPLPINNQELFYTYQGLTQDGKYYVSAVLPVNVGFLPADSSQQTLTPLNGVPFDWNNFQNMPVYLQEVKEKLQATDANDFTPPLLALDALIQSLNISLP